MTRYFVRLVWSGENHQLLHGDCERIVKETLGTFVDEQLSPVDAISWVGTKLLKAGAHVTHLHYVAAMECIDPAIEKQVYEAEKNLVEEFTPAYIDGCVRRTAAREQFAKDAERHRLEAMKRPQQ